MKHGEHMPMPKAVKKATGGVKKKSAPGGWPTHFNHPGGFKERRGK